MVNHPEMRIGSSSHDLPVGSMTAAGSYNDEAPAAAKEMGSYDRAQKKDAWAKTHGGQC